ncbi:MAG: VWA domain-containing protein, partial [Actinomycetota bacterium]
MTFANPAGLWLLTALIGVLALHILRPRRSDTVVSSSMLWETETVGATAASPWQRLTPTVSLLLQMLAVILAALALARPVIESDAELADHTVVVLDASASMAAGDGATGADRLAEAKSVAIGLWDQRPNGGTVSLVVGTTRPRVAVTSTADRDTFVGAVEAVEQSDGPLDLDGAMTLADGLESPEQTIGIILVSDGRHDDDDLRALPPGVTHRLVGADDVNRAITALNVRLPAGDEDRSTGTMTVVATIEVTGGPEVTVPVRIDVDGATAAVEDVTVGPEQDATLTVEVPVGDQVIARLVDEDLLAIDDTAYAQARRADDVAISVEGASDPFVEALLDALPGVSIVDPARDVPDATVFVGIDVPTDISRPFWAIAPPSGLPGVEVNGTVESPVPTLIRAGDRLLAGLDLSALQVAEAQRLDAPTAETLVGAEGAPLLLRGRRAGLPFIYTGFDLGRSSLPLDVAFPILGDRILQELAGSSTVPPVVRVGDRLEPPSGRTAVVTDPAGNEVAVAAEGGSVTIDRPGFWTVTPDGGRPATVAASLAPSESSIGPVPVAPSEPRVLRVGEEAPTFERSFRWLAIVAFGLAIAVEWWWWRPRSGVPRWQRRSAEILRGVSLAALALALIGFAVPLPAREVATVFVVDRSDSVGLRGQEVADRWVSDAIEARIDAEGSARSGVVASGDGARVDQLLRDRDRANTATVVEIDGDRTDLAAGLRLAGALLPDEARRRVVVLSDGRATTGDARAEAEDLARRGISVEYVLIDEGSGSDASVASVRAPSTVAEGEAVVVEAVIDSTVAQPAVVTLRRNGEVVSSTELDLEEGTTSVALQDSPPSGGLVSYDV